jgi:hypothetical protein
MFGGGIYTMTVNGYPWADYIVLDVIMVLLLWTISTLGTMCFVGESSGESRIPPHKSDRPKPKN